MRHIFLALLLTIGAYFSAFAQLLPDNLHFKHFGIDEGLSEVHVNDLAQDEQGFIWMGTINGLFRYDGIQMKKYAVDANDPHSISHNYISDIYPSKKGGIWITNSGGLNYYDPVYDRFDSWQFSKRKEDQNKPPNELYLGVLEAKDGTVWISHFSYGIIHFDPVQDTFQYWPTINDSKTSFSVMIEDANGNLLFGSSAKGISLYDSKNKRFNSSLAGYEAFQELKDQQIEALVKDDQHNIWLVTDDQFFYFDWKSKKLHDLTDQLKANVLFNAIEVDRKGRIWIGSNTGTFCYYPKNGKAQHFVHSDVDEWTLRHNQLTDDILEDQQGLIWFSGQKGVHQLDPLSFNVEHLVIPPKENLPQGNDIMALTVDDNQKLWLLNSKGVSGYDIANREFSAAPKALQKTAGRRYPYDLAYDGHGNLWLSQLGQIVQYNLKDEKASILKDITKDKNGVPYGTHITFVIKPDRDGSIWFGSRSEGIIHYQPTENTFEKWHWKDGEHQTMKVKPDLPVSAYNIALAPNGKVWFSCNNGLNLLESSNDYMHYFRHDPDDSTSVADDSHFSGFLVDSQGRSWIGTKTGLHLYDSATHTFKRYGKAHGLPSTTVLGMFESNQQLWLMTGKGLCQFDPKLEKAQQYRPLDGFLRSYMPNVTQDSTGHLYFSIQKGILRFHPDSIKQNTFLPTVLLTDFLLFNKSVKDSTLLPKSISALEEITLQYDQYIFSFEFVAMNLRQSHRNQYKYKLKGLSDDWIETDAKNPRATFTNLNPGSYTFMVKASNDDGFWNETPTTIKVIVLPPWYLTWWAKLLWTLLTIGSALSFYFWRVNTLKRQKVVLEQQVVARTKEIRIQRDEIIHQKEEILQQSEELQTSNEKLVQLHQFKEDMGNMVVHDFKAPLNSIIWYGRGNEKVAASAQRLQHLLENFLDVHRGEQVGMELKESPVAMREVIQQAMKQAEALAGAKSIQLLNQVPTPLYVRADQDLLLRVLVNLMSNAVKYTTTQGSISFTAVDLDEEVVRIAVKDTGIGIPKDQLGQLFDKYAQAEMRNSGSIRSTGLGLTFCKLAIEAHGGSIWVESEEGEGTTFFFTLQKAEKPPEISEVNPSEQPKEEWQLSDEEQAIIRPFIPQLAKLDDSQVAEVRKVLKQLNVESAMIIKWKGELMKSCFANNTARYHELLGMIV